MPKRSGVVLSIFVAAFAGVAGVRAQVPSVQNDAVLESVVTIALGNETDEHAVGSGLVVRSDGYIVTANSLVSGSKDIRVRLKNGEMYDHAQIVAADERRNIAVLHIAAINLRPIPSGTSEESQVGSHVSVLANPTGKAIANTASTLNSVQMADNIPGAGKGYRLLEIDPAGGTATTGGLLLDEVGRSLGVVTTTPETKGHNIAVPLTSILGLIRSASLSSPATVTTVASISAPENTPMPIPQTSVAMPERGVVALDAKGPGSVVVRPKTIPEVMAASKTIYVRSWSNTFKPEQLVNALLKQKEFGDFGFTFVDDEKLADLVLDIDHVVMTWKYTFRLSSQRLGVVVATGDRIIWDGNLGADAMAERVVEKLKAARGPEKKPATATDDKGKSKDTK